MPSRSAQSASPDYSGLVKFLIQPFLESADTLSIDLEYCKQDQRIWVRLALEEADKGKVYGRGGRNLQAIRSILETAAQGTGRSLYLEVYEAAGEEESRRGRRTGYNGDGMERRPSNRRPRSAPRRPTGN